MQRSVSFLFQSAEALLFPRRCVFCGDFLPGLDTPAPRWTSGGATFFPEIPLCGDCQDALIPPSYVGCRYCGAFFENPIFSDARCSACRNRELDYDAVIPFGEYERTLREAILAMKLPEHQPLAEAVAQLAFRYRGKLWRKLRPDVLIPVPMHRFYRWVRGINSAEVLARIFSKALDVPTDSTLVRCGRMTLSQRSVPMAARLRNVQEVFQPCKKRNENTWQGKRALLVDDVLTTGATCGTLAKILKEQFGFSFVGVVVLAKAKGKKK